MGLAHSQAYHVRQCGLLDKDMPCGFTQPGAVTAGAAGCGHVIEQVFTDGIGFRFPVTALHVGDDPLEGMVALDDVAAVVEVAKLDAFLAGAVKDFLADGFVQ